jgi:signal transduction histidine kinase
MALEAGSVGTWQWDIPDNVLTWDQRMYELYGVSIDTPGLAYEHWQRALHPEDRERSEAAITLALQGEKEFTQRFHIVLPNGNIRHIQAYALIERDDTNTPLRMIGLNQDVSAEVEAQEALNRAKEMAEAAGRAKADFLATMSHEIRTPMNGVIGMTNLLLDTSLDEQQLDYANTVKSCGNSLLALINDILDFSKSEAGRMTIEAIPFSAQDLAKEVASLFSAIADEKSLNLSVEVSNPPPPSVIGDPTSLRQVVTNLVSNALKFTTEGGVTIAVAISDSEETPDEGFCRLQIAVKDTGIGLSEKAQKNLFQPFTQADSSTTRKFGGTGLELSISRRLAEMIGGTLAVSSIQGSGSTFSIDLRLPVAVSDPFAAIESGERSLRVLLIEDDADRRRSIAEWLSGWHCHLAKAAGASTALNKVQTTTKPYDLILIKGALPIIDGPRAVGLLRDEPAAREVPVVLYGPAPEELLAQLDGNQPMVQAIETPTGHEFLRSAIERLIGRNLPDEVINGTAAHARNAAADRQFEGVAGGRQSGQPEGGHGHAGQIALRGHRCRQWR